MQASDTQTTAVPPPPLPAPPPAAGRVTRPRSQQIALFFASFAWYYCALSFAASAANGIAVRFDLNDTGALLQATFLLFLTILGFAFLRVLERRRAPLSLILGLPRRSTSRAEWALGIALGWGIALAVIIPMALIRTLNVRMWTSSHSYELLGLNLATIALLTLTTMLVFNGYPFQRLIEAIGPTRATILMAILMGIGKYFEQNTLIENAGAAVLAAIVFSVFISLAWIRTHGVWLSWGILFGWNASVALLFGLPLQGSTLYSTVIETRTQGPLWLTGGSYGPNATLFTILFLLAAIPILIRATSDYAWSYTHAPIIPGGYDVTIPPPAAHAAMEQAALERAAAEPVNPASLIQILPAAPAAPTSGSSPE